MSLLTEKLRHGAALHQGGNLTDAARLYQEILGLEPRQFEALYRLGVIEGVRNNWDRAAELLGAAVEANPDDATAHCDRGVALRVLGQWGAALEAYDRAIAIRPDFAQAHSNRGNIFRELGRLDEALVCYERAIAIRADYAEAHYNRGVVLQQLRRLSEALASYDLAITARPGYVSAHSNRGVVLEHLHRLDEALAAYECAVAAGPGHAQALSNRGNVLRMLNRADDAIASCDRALELQPGNALAHVHKALALLLAGDLRRGWAEYEWRWRVDNSPLFRPARRFAQPLWLGREPVAGRTVLIHAEQGLGDTLQFCRYVRLVAGLGAKVVLEVQRPLVGLLANLDGAAAIVGSGDPLPDFDYHCPLLSLPLAFDTTLATIPASVPYIACDRQQARQWQARLGDARRLRVGLAWSGGFRSDVPDHWSAHSRRNIPLAKLAALRHADVDFFSLQKGQPAESELAQLQREHWDGPRLIDVSAELHDFPATASLVANLDLVITVDTSIAHLAGALGRRVWILNRFDTCWRWLLDRSDSPWYPTATLYRQQRPGDWDGVVQKVRADLDAAIHAMPSR